MPGRVRSRHLTIKVSESEKALFFRLAEDLGEPVSAMLRRWAQDAFRARFGAQPVHEVRRGR